MNNRNNVPGAGGGQPGPGGPGVAGPGGMVPKAAGGGGAPQQGQQPPGGQQQVYLNLVPSIFGVEDLLCVFFFFLLSWLGSACVVCGLGARMYLRTIHTYMHLEVVCVFRKPEK